MSWILRSQAASRVEVPKMPTCSGICTCNHIHAYAACALFLICVICATVECTASFYVVAQLRNRECLREFV